MAQVVLKCSNSQDSGFDDFLGNGIVEDTLEGLSELFGEFCNSLASKGLFVTGYRGSVSSGNQGGSVEYQYGGLVHRTVFATYAPRWLAYARQEFSGYFSELTFNAFESVINRINTTNNSSDVNRASEGVRKWNTLSQVWEVLNAGADNDLNGGNVKLASGWRGNTWFDLFPSKRITKLYGLEYITPVIEGNFTQHDVEFLDTNLNKFHIGMSRGYSAGFLPKLGTNYAHTVTTVSGGSGD